MDPYERNFVHGVYDLDLKKFAKGIYGELSTVDPNFFKEKQIEFLDQKLHDRANHLQRSLAHLTKARNKQIVIFIDNCDQRDDEIQQQAFLVAQELAVHWLVTVFVTLRPETFYRSIKTGALTGYHPKAFTISPPRVNLVVEKRLHFGLKLTTGEIPICSLPRKTSVSLTSLDAVIRVFLNALEQSHWLRECLDNISGGNVRRALDLVREFFGSGHVDTEKIVRIFTESGRYYIAQHEFLRAVIYGDAVHYDPEKSPIANVFDVSFADAREHFLMPLLLAVLTNASGVGVDDGFVETGRVYEHLHGLGFVPDQIDECVVRAHRFKLLEFSARRTPQQDHRMPHAIRATSIGAYHLQRLCGMFAYIDAIIVDTPIFDPRMRGQIRDARSIEDRLQRGKIFRQYLDKQWASFDGLAKWLQWQTLSEQIGKDIADIEARVTHGIQGDLL